MNPKKYYILGKSDKILFVIGELSKTRKDKITVEDVAVKLWQKWPSEFCMRGYSQYPNVDIQKYITKLLDNNIITGGVFNYKITEKGKDYFARLLNLKDHVDQKKGVVSAEHPRYIRSEINRILNSRAFKYFLENKEPQFLESDFFDFLGTTARSFSTKDRNIFLNHYNTIVKDVLSYCEKTKEKDDYSKKIIELWSILSKQFAYILEKK